MSKESGKGDIKTTQYAEDILNGKYTLDSLRGQIPDSWIKEVEQKLKTQESKQGTEEENDDEVNDSIDPILNIPSKYAGLNADTLEELWVEKIYLDSEKNEFKKQERRDAINALRDREIKELTGLFAEEEEQILAILPKEFYGLSSSLIDDVWEFPGGNIVQKDFFEKRKKLVLEFIKNKENKLVGQHEKNKRHIEEQQKIKDISKQLGKDILNESREKKPVEFNSHELNNDELHAYGNLEKDGLEVMYLNNDHNQDAFAIYEDTYVVSDGASSYGKAGAMSDLLSSTIAKQVSESSLDEVFSKDSIVNIIDNIKNNKSYIDSFSVNSHAIKNEENKEAGLATLLAVKLNKEEKTISYTSIGDSPLFVIDRDESGKITSFEIMNEDAKITNENYFTDENHENMKNPETHLIGVRGNGNNTVSSLDSKKSGVIDYKENRIILLGSDALIKNLIFSPEIWENKAKNKPHIAHLFDKARERYEKNFPELWTQNPATGKKMFNPLFFTNLSKDKMSLLLSEWKKDAYPAADDMTIIAIDLDKHFKT